MSSFPSLPSRANLVDLFRRFPKGAGPLMALHDAFLRKDDSELSMGERELIATYVSALNTCTYCFDAHRTLAQAFGVDDVLIDELLSDIDGAETETRLKPIFKIARKVTVQETILPGDVQSVLKAGWNEDTLYDVLMIASLYNMMNRVVSSAGLSPKQSYEDAPKANVQSDAPRTYKEWGLQAGFLSDT